MCGIVGYIGKRQASDLLVEGLSKLEYRGYDSAGVAIIEDEKISVRKLKGRLANLENDLNSNSINGHIGIGHTRWATPAESYPLYSNFERPSTNKSDACLLPIYPTIPHIFYFLSYYVFFLCLNIFIMLIILFLIYIY